MRDRTEEVDEEEKYYKQEEAENLRARENPSKAQCRPTAKKYEGCGMKSNSRGVPFFADPTGWQRGVQSGIMMTRAIPRMDARQLLRQKLRALVRRSFSIWFYSCMSMEVVVYVNIHMCLDRGSLRMLDCIHAWAKSHL